MKYFIIAGEPSGDLHGSNLVRNLIMADAVADISCWGGDLMKEAGAKLLKHYRETAFMGAWEVVVNIRKVQANLTQCRSQIDSLRPDVVILIDYPGFNLRIAQYVKHAGIRVFYYIPPKLWAWNEGRVEKIKKYVDRLYIIFPFEKAFYSRHGYNAVYLGNPLIDQVESWRMGTPEREALMTSIGLVKKPVIALLAGSRLQEVKKILPEMVSVAGSLPDYQFVVAGMDHLPEKMYSDIIGSMPVKVIYRKTYDLLSVAEAALVTSGTATLEAALFDVPQVVCYKTSSLTYHLAKSFLKIRFLSLVNLIMDRAVVKELIQQDLNQMTLHRELMNIIRNGQKHDIIKSDYKQLRGMLGDKGASERIASDMIDNLKSSGKQS
jgi:lipid-A-disaccharide synthase